MQGSFYPLGGQIATVEVWYSMLSLAYIYNNILRRVIIKLFIMLEYELLKQMKEELNWSRLVLMLVAWWLWWSKETLNALLHYSLCGVVVARSHCNAVCLRSIPASLFFFLHPFFANYSRSLNITILVAYINGWNLSAPEYIRNIRLLDRWRLR